MSKPQKKLGFQLFLVSRAHHNLASQVFEQLGLHRGQPPVLFELGHRDGMTQNELAAKLEVTPATITNMLRRMELSGFIYRVRDTLDRRTARVFLTESGNNVLLKAIKLADQMHETAFAGFSSAEQEMLNNFLERIHTNLIK